MTQTEYALRPGETIEFIHRVCPRCGLDLTQEPHQAGDDQGHAEQVESDAGHAGAAGITRDFESGADTCLQRMVAPLTKAEKEHAKRNEQHWLLGQTRQESAGSEKEYGQASRHEHLIPMIKRKFREWILHR